MSGMYKEIDFVQPESFQFTSKNMKEVEKILAKYPTTDKQAAVMPLLHLAQKQHHNWIPRAAMDHIAELLEMNRMHVYEVANFYTMYNKQPVGENLIQICRTTPCWLRGSDDILEACYKKLGTGLGETTEDKKFTLVEVECLGACVNAPVVQINNDYYENLDVVKINSILDKVQS